MTALAKHRINTYDQGVGEPFGMITTDSQEDD